MMSKEYDSLQEHENHYQIAIDFDGVVYKNSKGYHDGTLYDEPIEGALEAIKSFSDKGYTIVSITSKDCLEPLPFRDCITPAAHLEQACAEASLYDAALRPARPAGWCSGVLAPTHSRNASSCNGENR